MLFIPTFCPNSGISFKSQATSTSTSVTAPSNIVAGDLLVFVQRAGVPTPPTAAAPSGFTIVATEAGGGMRLAVSWKIANGSEANTNLSGMPSNYSSACILLVFTTTGINGLASSAWLSQFTNDNPSPQVVAAASPVPRVVFGVYSSSGDIDPVGFSPAPSNHITVTSLGPLIVAYRIDNGVAHETTIDMDDEGNLNVLASGYIGIAPSIGSTFTIQAGSWYDNSYDGNVSFRGFAPQSTYNNYHDSIPSAYGALSPTVTETGDTVYACYSCYMSSVIGTFNLQLNGNIAAGTKRLVIGANDVALSTAHFNWYEPVPQRTLFVWDFGSSRPDWMTTLQAGTTTLRLMAT